MDELHTDFESASFQQSRTIRSSQEKFPLNAVWLL